MVRIRRPQLKMNAHKNDSDDRKEHNRSALSECFFRLSNCFSSMYNTGLLLLEAEETVQL
jgi:hypothetical protein